MPTYRDYWEGTQLASVTTFSYSGSGVHADGATRAINTAFAVYHTAMQYVRAMEAIKSGSGAKVRDDLRDAANAGWGTGVQDLSDAFGHVAKNSGTWRDTKYSHYFGGFGQFHSFIPNAAYHFFKAIDERIAEAAELQKKHLKAREYLEAAAKVGTPQWATMNEHVKTVSGVLEKMGTYMWLIPAAVAGKSPNLALTLSNGVEIGEKVTAYAGMFLTAASETRSAVESFDNALQARFTTSEAVLLAGLQRLAGFLPVMGEFYSQAIGLIPNVANLMTTIAEHKQEMLMLARFGPARDQQMRHLGSE